MSDVDAELRGSTPVYTAKEILQGLDKKVTELDLKMNGALLSLQVMVSQNLDSRILALEISERKREGMVLMLKAMFGGNILILIIAIISVIAQFAGIGTGN